MQYICSNKRILIILWILFLPGLLIFSQDHKTKNNYTGAWQTPSSWDPAWPVPQTNINNSDITINGYITANNSLRFSGASSNLIVDDTLIINGNLTIEDGNDIQVNNNGILIVRGNLIFSEHSRIEANNYIIVTGNITKLGSTNHGQFNSDDNPVKVFIGGIILPSSLFITKPNFPVLNCSSPPTTPYSHSGCSYGDITDIIADPIYMFFQSTCTAPSLTSSDSDNSFCQGTGVTFTSGGGTKYNFRVNAISVQNGASATYTTTSLTNGAIVDVIVTGTCTSTSSGITNTVFALPVPTAINNGPVCSGSALNLTGGPAAMTIYSWTGPNGFTSLLQNPSVSDKAALIMDGIYSLTITNASGCSDVATTIVTINDNPVAFAGTDQELTFLFETQMEAELSPPETGEWTLVSGIGRINAIHSPTTTITELLNGVNIFLWKVQNGSCKASDEVKITVYELFIPSVITPDGDGKNDYFKISENIGKVELIIFNRWGNEEYRNNNYLNDWDGRNNSGAQLPYDTYFYILKLEKGIIKKGSVLILR